MDDLDLEFYLKLAQKYGLTHLRISDFEFTMPLKVEVPPVIETTLPPPSISNPPNMPSDEEMLLYSTISFDEKQHEGKDEAN